MPRLPERQAASIVARNRRNEARSRDIFLEVLRADPPQGSKHFRRDSWSPVPCPDPGKEFSRGWALTGRLRECRRVWGKLPVAQRLHVAPAEAHFNG